MPSLCALLGRRFPSSGGSQVFEPMVVFRRLVMRSALLITLVVCPATVVAEEEIRDGRWESTHSIEVGGETVDYDAVVASTTLVNDEGEDAAELFYTAYFRTNGAPSGERPLIFSYNGGPGSASFWLHMGIMGPRRVVTPEVGPQGAPPYPLEDNEFTLLDMADIVMVDPIGTGFSHTLEGAEGSDYWGIDEDARSLAQFIRRFLSEYDRWNSPRFLLGESYGTTRSAVLAGHLQRANIDLNGIVLVSVVLQFNTIQFAPGDDIPYIVNLPSYAITARYLDALPGGSPDELEAILAEAEAWSGHSGAAPTPASPDPPGTSSQLARRTIRSPPRSAPPTRRRSTATSAASWATTATASTSRAAAPGTGTGAGSVEEASSPVGAGRRT